AFLLAAGGFLYPEIKKTYSDFRHSRTLNRLIVQAEAYQKDQRLHYMSDARLREELDAVTAPPVPLSRGEKTAGEGTGKPANRHRDRS
ncbi:MAG: hypothetical protein ABIS20_18440, partial [Thermoanaerobaculia bacterium]